MAWVTSNSVHNIFASLCTKNGDTITVKDGCLAKLEEILRQLVTEHCTLRTFRRSIGFGQNIRKSLIPLLLYVKDGTKLSDTTEIIDTVIKILVNLTIPVEYLLPVEAMSRVDVGRQTIFELNRLLTTSKEAFTDGRSTKAIVDHMKYILENHSELSYEQCESINNCLLLLRNILHIPESKSSISNSPVAHSSMQNQIIWNLFAQGVDKIIIFLISCPQKIYWDVTMVQLISIMYKDQHVGTLQKLLNLWLEASYSESSEDNESNTSPPDQGSDDSSPVITSDATSDSSDNGGNDRNKHNNKVSNSESSKNNNAEVVKTAQSRGKPLVVIKRNKSTETETSTSSGVSSMAHSTEFNENQPVQYQLQPTCQQLSNKKITSLCPSSQSEISDCGYVTQIENQESISSSSNDDDQPQEKTVPQKQHSFQKTRYNNGKNRATTILEKKEIRRKKLVKRSKTNVINMKGLMHHMPTDEDVANILKEFTVDFLLKGYGTLVNDLRSQLLTDIHVNIDTSHFFWLMTYFLKFATQLELDAEHITPVLSHDILSYLVFQGVWIYEELEISRTVPEVDLKPCLRRLHLVVLAIREFLQGMEAYQKMIHLNDNDRENLLKLQERIRAMEDLKMLFVLLLRQYDPNVQSRQYLQDLILTNHNILLFLDNTAKTQDQRLNMVEHLKQFATVEIMHKYSLLLESFRQNGEFVNNCILTMMHHISGDLKSVSTLFQPCVLKIFSQIWETDYELCDDWSDLIEYVIHKFINTPGTYSPAISNTHFTSDHLQDDLKKSDQHASTENDEWIKEENDILSKYYNQSGAVHNTIGKITEKYDGSGSRHKTQLSIIPEVLEQNIADVNEYNSSVRNNKQMDKIEQVTLHKNFEVEEVLKSEENAVNSDIKILKEYLYKRNKRKLIIWLQNILIEAYYVKQVLNDSEVLEEDSNIVESIIYHFALLDLPIPIIPWTAEQTNILRYQPFVLLLHKLGLQLPADTGKTFVRIPNYWTADDILCIARQLGPIDHANLKFDVSKFSRTKYDQSEENTEKSSPLYEAKTFSMVELKQTPSIVCCTPLSSQLSLAAFPGIQVKSYDISPPELINAKTIDSNMKNAATNMEYSPLYETDELVSIDDLERNSNCDTGSVASGLTRMCVSDEEEKMMLVIENIADVT